MQEIFQPHYVLMAGYWCRGIVPHLRLQIIGEGDFVVDTVARPVRFSRDRDVSCDLTMRLSPRELEAWVHNTSPASLATTGQFELSGTDEAMSRFRGIWDKPSNRGVYAPIADLVPDRRYVFMNFGYAPADDFPLQDEDQNSRYAISLFRNALGSQTVRGKRVLEVGCGRGGACSFISRYLSPDLLVGIDAVEKCLEFCHRTQDYLAILYVQAEAGHLPFPPASFDLIINVVSSYGFDFPAFFARRPEFFERVASFVGPTRLSLEPRRLFSRHAKRPAGSLSTRRI